MPTDFMDQSDQSVGGQGMMMMPGQGQQLASTPAGGDKKRTASEAEKKEVRLWAQRVTDRKKKAERDFKRMRKNMDFHAGMQWEAQEDITFDKYVCNITMQLVNQKVATLYARKPQVLAQRRKRKDFAIWDEKPETLAAAAMRLSDSMQGGEPDMDAALVMADFDQGTRKRLHCQAIGETLEILYQYECDRQDPDFKEQMKQLVRTVVVCGVGYVRMHYFRNEQESGGPSAVQVPSTQYERQQRARLTMEKFQKGELSEDDARTEQLKQLALTAGLVAIEEANEIQEGLAFDYPLPTAIIVDEQCRNLKTFAGARWMAQEYVLPLEEVNAFFGSDIKMSGDLKTYTAGGERSTQAEEIARWLKDESSKPMVCVWEIFDKLTRTRRCIVDGYDQYVLEPEPVVPLLKRFWPIYGLTFNDVVCEPGTKVTVYPPSDVDLVKHAQKEWNRSRNALRAQRRANAARYIARKGLLTPEDKLALNTAEENSVVELTGIPLDTEPSKFILPMAREAIDPMAYDTGPLENDIMLAGRAQEANMGPARPNVTATVGTIAEQSRMTVAASNVDDLDGLLSALAENGGQMLMQEMPLEVVKQVVGEGAVWPVEDMPSYINEIALTVVASSSGRPNQALEIANFERLAPLLLQFGANPQFLVREAVKRMDDRLDVNEAFPVMPPQLGRPEAAAGGNQEAVAPGTQAQPQKSVPDNVTPMVPAGEAY